MPEGPLGGKRLTNIGPLSRSTREEVERNWGPCPDHEQEKMICEEIKVASLSILKNQDFFAECQDLIDINSGNCYKVAERVAKELDYVSVMRIGDGDHFWIEYNGKHFDAEVPSGSVFWRDLPIFGRIPPDQMLRFARTAAEVDDEPKPETVEQTIKNVTEDIR